MVEKVISRFGLPENSRIRSFGSGLINNTWLIETPVKKYILQRVNHQVFKQPESIARNIRLLHDYIKQYKPDYFFVAPLKTVDGQELYFAEGEGFFRLFYFVDDSHTVNVVENEQQAYEAARQFGLFSATFNGFDAAQLSTTIADFHNLILRYEQFLTALQNVTQQRRAAAEPYIQFLISKADIATSSVEIFKNPGFKLRVTHHDTKISNVLFNKQDKGICVIDLDTVMPGYFISDVGDMMRTYLSPVGEEEKDYDKIQIRLPFFRAIIQGYLSEMGQELSNAEKAHVVFAGKYLIYMQALRFLTDYLQNDVYYGEQYPGHNLVRAGNQCTLLQRFIEKEDELNEMVQQFFQ